jgi:hypothetical protein
MIIQIINIVLLYEYGYSIPLPQYHLLYTRGLCLFLINTRKKKMNLNYIITVDLSVRLVAFTVDISKDYIQELDIEYGSTYSFIVSYGIPLTFKGVPYNPLELKIENIKEGPITLKSSIFYNSNFPLDDESNGTVRLGYNGKEVKYEEILYTAIWGLVSKSDLLKGIMINRRYRVSDNNTSIFRDMDDNGNDENAPTFITPGVPGYDTMKMSLACYKITKDVLSIEDKNLM